MNQKKLALSLSGGGARALAYLGFIRGLSDKGVKVDFINAQSAAAWLLPYLASGFTDQEIINDFKKFRMWKFFSLHPWSSRGFIDLDKLIKYFELISQGLGIQDLTIKTSIVVSDLTDFDNPKRVVVTNGSIAKYAVISSIIPPLMPIFVEQGRLYADAAFSSVYAADDLRARGADVVIGLYSDALKHTKLPGFIEGQVRVIKSLTTHVYKQEKRENWVDLELRSFNFKSGLYDFKCSQKVYESGYQKAIVSVKKIEQLIYS